MSVDVGSRARMMGGGLGHRDPGRTCRPRADLPGTRVSVLLGDPGMSHMMGGVAPPGARMMLHARPRRVPAGDVTFVVTNRGWRTHELVVLPLAPDVPAGRRRGPPRRVRGLDHAPAPAGHYELCATCATTTPTACTRRS